MNTKRPTTARRRVEASRRAYSSAEHREFNEEIDNAVRDLHDLGKSPADALSMLQTFKRGKPSTDGWTQHQVCAAVKLGTLLGLRREALRDPSNDGLVTMARWLGEASQQIVKRNFARKGGRRPKKQADILAACCDIRARFPSTKARRAYRVLSHVGHKMPDGKVIRFQKHLEFSTFQTRYWPKQKS
jgi:hypothetical protein